MEYTATDAGNPWYNRSGSRRRKVVAIGALRRRFLPAIGLLALAAGGCAVDPDRDETPANRPPVITRLGAVSDTVATNAEAAFWVEAGDADGDTLTYAWSATGGAFTSATDVAAVTWVAPAAASQETLRVVVGDGQLTAAADIPVTVLTAAPRLGPLPSLLQLNLARSRVDLVLLNPGFGPLHWSATSDVGWLRIEPAGGAVTVADTVAIVIDRGPLAAGGYLGRIHLATDGGNATILVTIRAAAEPVYTYHIRARYPHDPTAFTQGLLYHDGFLFESTGLLGASSLRRVDLESGVVRQRRNLDANLFGEGLALWDTTLIQLTWQNQTALRWGLRSFDSLGTFSYATQGWGLTADAARLIMSDGTARLFFRDPQTFALLGEMPVTDSRGEVAWLNELEWIAGEVWANVWRTDDIVRIDPATGRIVGWLDLSGLLTAAEAQAADVLNGIAWDAAGGRLFVTGKNWPWLFWIEVVPAE